MSVGLTPFGVRCRQHRTGLGLIMADQAKELKCSVSYISAIERGDRTVPEGYAEAVAVWLGLSERESRQLLRLSGARKHADDSEQSKSDQLAQLSLNFDSSLDAASAERIRSVRKQVASAPLSIRSVEDVRELALLARSCFELGDRLSLDLAAILENKLALVDRNFSLEVRADYEMGDQLSAYSDAMIKTVKRIVLSEHIYNSLVRREPNANFVAAHELGHWLMHPSTHAFSSKLHRARFRSAEDDADCFAREFLMPKSTVSQFSTAGQLAMASGVTRDVAARRLEEFGRLKDHNDRDKISRGFHDLVRELGKTSEVRSRIGQDVSVSDSPSLQSPPIATDRFNPQQMLDALGFYSGHRTRESITNNENIAAPSCTKKPPSS